MFLLWKAPPQKGQSIHLTHWVACRQYINKKGLVLGNSISAQIVSKLDISNSEHRFPLIDLLKYNTSTPPVLFIVSDLSFRKNSKPSIVTWLSVIFGSKNVSHIPNISGQFLSAMIMRSSSIFKRMCLIFNLQKCSTFDLKCKSKLSLCLDCFDKQVSSMVLESVVLRTISCVVHALEGSPRCSGPSGSLFDSLWLNCWLLQSVFESSLFDVVLSVVNEGFMRSLDSHWQDWPGMPEFLPLYQQSRVVWVFVSQMWQNFDTEREPLRTGGLAPCREHWTILLGLAALWSLITLHCSLMFVKSFRFPCSLRCILSFQK